MAGFCGLSRCAAKQNDHNSADEHASARDHHGHLTYSMSNARTAAYPSKKFGQRSPAAAAKPSAGASCSCKSLVTHAFTGWHVPWWSGSTLLAGLTHIVNNLLAMIAVVINAEWFS
jgi:hypothetical protein